MAYVYRVWRTPLSAYVNYLWVAEGYVQPHAHEFVLPAPSLTLVIDLDVEKADAILICGARSQPLVLGTAKPLRLMAAVFKPGCGFPFADCQQVSCRTSKCRSAPSGRARRPTCANAS